MTVKEYLLFADETGANSDNPYFCFSGIIFAREYYENYVIPEFNALKKKHFGTTDIIFHFSDMKKAKGNFKTFSDKKIRNDFWREYSDFISKLDMEIIATFFNVSHMNELYPDNSHSNYDVGFYSLLNNFKHYLTNKKGFGQLCIESRSLKENSYLQNTFYEYLTEGSILYSSKDIQDSITSLGFVIKKENCVGLQIADMVPSQLLRKYTGKPDHLFGISTNLYSKLYKFGSEYEHILGLKNIL